MRGAARVAGELSGSISTRRTAWLAGKCRPRLPMGRLSCVRTVAELVSGIEVYERLTMSSLLAFMQIKNLVRGSEGLS